jgi:hypothetical protein
MFVKESNSAEVFSFRKLKLFNAHEIVCLPLRNREVGLNEIRHHVRKTFPVFFSNIGANYYNKLREKVNENEI